MKRGGQWKGEGACLLERPFTYYTAKPTAGKSCVTGSDRKAESEAGKQEGVGPVPVLGVAGLPLREILLHRVTRHVPREHLNKGTCSHVVKKDNVKEELIDDDWQECYIIERVALISTNPEAGGTVTGKVVQIYHVHLLVKSWEDEDDE